VSKIALSTMPSQANFNVQHLWRAETRKDEARHKLTSIKQKRQMALGELESFADQHLVPTFA
jgi:hypothetical protein